MTQQREKEQPAAEVDPQAVDIGVEDAPEAETPPHEAETQSSPEEESEEDPQATLERLQNELEEAQAQAAEYLEGWQRARAEFANYRRRQQAEQQKQVQLSNALLISRILPVMDDLERALMALPSSLRNFTWIDGIALIYRKLELVLEAEGMKPIETAGQTFDPHYHEAISYEEAPGYEEGHIIEEVQRGYVLGERVIRPALVRVARAPASPPTPKSQDEEAVETEPDTEAEPDTAEE
jgi:molecular chaperone GrpE